MSAVAYLASYLARAKYVPASFVAATMERLLCMPYFIYAYLLHEGDKPR